MKHTRILFATGFLLLGLQAWAQPEKGSMMIGGTAGFNSYSQNDNTSTTFNFSPQVGFFITDRFEVGAIVALFFFGDDGDNFNILGIGPFLRYYVNGSGDARFFGQGQIQYSSTDLGANFDSQSNFGFGAGFGIDYFLNNNVALEAIMGFSSNKDEGADESQTQIGLNIGVAAFIGGGDD
ncbi:MAG TPA: outer membrane beta-barrel protein [Saprospiraceae bacterium]|nr:outer membrane beta-barrel protein [Saprospiraceae bacterium]